MSFFRYLIPDIWYLISGIWISGYLEIWYLNTWMPGYLIPDTWWGTHTWWGAHIHGVEPTYMVAWPAALVGGQVGGGQGGAHPGGIRYSGIQVSRYPGIHVSRYQMSRYPDIRYHIPDIRYQKKDVKLKNTIFPKSQK